MKKEEINSQSTALLCMYGKTFHRINRTTSYTPKQHTTGLERVPCIQFEVMQPRIKLNS